MQKKSVGILGCTGAVGQRFIQLLANHPWFQVTKLGASERSAGQAYEQAVNWKQTIELPQAVKKIQVTTCDAKNFADCDLVFSGLDSSVAGPIEEAIAQSEIPVFSNAKNHRYDEDVPILIPFANPKHLDIVEHQQKKRGLKRGFIVTNANCSFTGLAVPFAPLQKKFGIKKAVVVTMQAISGAGYPGVSSSDILDNIVPYIGGEEEKFQKEGNKILGNIQNGEFIPTNMVVSAQCNRVPVIDGHLECVSLEFDQKANAEEVKEALRQAEFTVLKEDLPSAPKKPLIVLEQEDRPQPRLDRDRDGGYTISVGRVRPCEILDVKFVVLSHNTIIGAAGGSILNAELAYRRGLLV